MTMPNQRTAEQAQLSTAELAAAGDRGPTPASQTDTAVEQAEERAEPFERKTADRAVSEAERKVGDQSAADNRRAPLFAGNEAESFRGRWSDIQAGFVDEPRHAVEQADELVAEVMQRLAKAFAEERQSLEQHWDRGTDINTEELRQALQRYRSFFDRLLAL